MEKTLTQKPSTKGEARRNSSLDKTRDGEKSRANGNIQLYSPSHASNPTNNGFSSSQIFHLQRTIGNRAVGRLIQAKFTVGQPDDEYEREADRVADTVMRMTAPRPPEDEENTVQAKSVFPTITPFVQRAQEDEEEPVQMKLAIQHQAEEPEEDLQTKPADIQRLCPECEKERAEEERTVQRAISSVPTPVIQRLCPECEKKLQRQPTPEDEEEKPIQAKSANGHSNQASSHVEANINAMKGGGSPLPESTRIFYESRFGADFGSVRVHADSRAAETSQSINARAFTVGSDIAFGSGQYAPETNSGKNLLAHELTHVVQQNNEIRNLAQGSVAKPQIQRFGLPEWIAGPAEAVGGAFASAAGWTGGQFTSMGREALECARATGRSFVNIVTLNVHSVTDLLGIPKPKEGNPGTLDIILSVLRHSCLKMLPGYSLVSQISKLEGVRNFIRGLWEVIQNPGLIIDAIKDALGGFIAQIPEKARAFAQKAITFSDPLQEHLEGIWRHLEPKLDYLANNWWEVIKQTGREMLFPWEYSGEDIDKIWNGIKSAGENLWALNISDAIDNLLEVWRAVNSLAGRWYGWFFIASVLIGTIIGAFFGGVGAIPGAAAGAAFALKVGYGLLISTLAAETLSIGKAGYDLVFREQTEEQEEEDYEQVANSGLTLAIIGIMFLLGALAVRSARGLIARVRGMFRPRLPQGFTRAQFTRLSTRVRQGAGHISDDIRVHGSRASRTATPTSDVDIAIRVTPERFDQLIAERFGRPNPGSAAERTMQHAIRTGKIQSGEAGLRSLRISLERELGMEVDLSVIRTGGPFDQGPWIPLQ